MHLLHASLGKLTPIRLPKVEPLPSKKVGGKVVVEVRAYLIAAGANRRPNRRHQVSRPAAKLRLQTHATPAPAIPAAVPRQPACSAPTARKRVSTSSTGTQSAVKIPNVSPTAELIIPSASTASSLPSTRTTRPEWTCFTVFKVAAESSVSSTPARNSSRFRRTTVGVVVCRKAQVQLSRPIRGGVAPPPGC